MRMDQFAGLCPAAEKFLEEHRRLPNVCKTCGHVIGGQYIKQIGTYSGGFYTGYPLYRHLLKNDKFADEFLQTSPWSSGPVHFLGLKLSNRIGFVWTDKEIEEWL